MEDKTTTVNLAQVLMILQMVMEMVESDDIDDILEFCEHNCEDTFTVHEYNPTQLLH